MAINLAPCGHPLDWTGLYRKDYDLATSESMAHPAKASWDLAFKILDHLKELGLLKEGDTILDPMSGTGRFLLAACAKGFKAIAVELEPKFIKMLEDNKAYASKKLCLPGFELPLTIIQGDARQLSQLLKERGLIALTSPPYSDSSLKCEDSPEDFGNRLERIKKSGSNWWRPRPTGNMAQTDYGSTPGQIGRLPDKLIAVSSPPYGDTTDRGKQDNEFLAKAGEKHHRLYTTASFKDEGYGSTPGQIGSLPDKPVAITSPPWNLQSGGRGEASRKSTPDNGLIDRHGGGIKGGSGDSPGNIGTLPDRPFTAITSPPYEDMEVVAGRQTTRNQGISRLYDPLIGPKFGKSEGQIGQEQGETYLEAMKIVYAEIAKVADVLVIVVKNPTRNGKLRRLDLDTIALLEATGWKLHCQHRAILFEEQEMGHLFEGQVKKPRGRLSFFKRLSYRKGSPVANHEDILVCVKHSG